MFNKSVIMLFWNLRTFLKRTLDSQLKSHFDDTSNQCLDSEVLDVNKFRHQFGKY